ncbi:MAG: NAD-dependent epimerase/dehydratase family protein, partial [Phycisphaerales bacterium]|nr:NAD-dependent epimerase/dehydratase family protein [Phycisphaerales bacterium]
MCNPDPSAAEVRFPGPVCYPQRRHCRCHGHDRGLRGDESRDARRCCRPVSGVSERTVTVAARPPCRVLVTGGAGFLGSHLCDRLLADGHAVTALDNYLTGRPENLAHLAGAERFTFVEADVRQPLSGRFDLIFHLACPASPTFYQADPVATATIAFLGTLNALQLARDCGARLVFASTSEVYG